MPLPAALGAQIMCSFGMAPSVLAITPEKRVFVEAKPMATIMDNVGMKNIPSFGLCTSLANPITAAQTASALGVLTPGACTPVIPAPWAPPSATVMVGGVPALSQTAKCFCAYGGVIQIVNPGTTREQIP